MSNSVSEGLSHVNELINKGKFEDALQHIKGVEQKKNLTPEDTLRILSYKGRIYYSLGQHESSLKMAEELYQNSQKMKNSLFSLDALFFKAGIFYGQQRLEEFLKILDQYETLFKSIPREDSIKFQEREAGLLIWKAAREQIKGDFDLALDYHQKSLMLFERVDPHSIYIPTILGTGMAYAYLNKGELDLALECDEKALSLIPEGENTYLMLIKSQIYRNMGIIYYQKGDLNHALEYHNRSLELLKKAENPTWMNASYLDLIGILLAKKNFKQAQNYLQQFKQFNEEHKSRFGNLMYQTAHALILKSSSRLRDRVEAEKKLKNIVEENLDDISIILIPYALIMLCDLYFEEFRLTNQIDILDDIYPLIDHLQRNAKLQNSYSLLANIKMLQAKLALIQINMVDARKLLTEAQIIADEHGLHLLAGEISREHDHLLEELKLWESFKKTQTSVSERLKLASVDVVLERMQGRRAIEPLESSHQQPVLLLILTEGGVLLFSYPFTDKWKHDDAHFGSFLSAFSTFSSEFFSQGLDRIKFGEDTILLQSVDNFSFCYLFRGQTYSAKQQLNFFSKALIKDNQIIGDLKNAANKGKMIELSDNPRIEEIIIKSFMSDPKLFRMPFKAYEGDEPFIFVSYTHADKLEVYPIIDYLNDMNIKIWYDEGIPVSEIWNKSIAINLERCNAFLVFISPQIINSKYVRKEISFAIKRNKPFFAVYLKETNLPTELGFEITDIQAMKKYLMPKSEFYINLKELLSKTLNN